MSTTHSSAEAQAVRPWHSGQFQALEATELPPLLQTGSDPGHFLPEGVLQLAHERLHIAGADLRARQRRSTQKQFHPPHTAPRASLVRIL